MTGIDQYAYTSPFSGVHPGEKILLAIMTMLVVLGLDSALVSSLVLLVMTALILLPGRVPCRIYLRLLFIPLVFLLVGCLSVAVLIQSEPSGLIVSLRAGAYWIGVSGLSLYSSLVLLLRCLACLACMYFLALTTPVIQIVYVLRRIKLPPAFVEVMGLIYYAIFDFLATAGEMCLAQNSRCGYNSFAASMRSLSTLAFNLFIKFLHRSNQSYDALLARGFTGSLQVLEESFSWQNRNIIAIVGFNAILVIVKTYGGG